MAENRIKKKHVLLRFFGRLVLVLILLLVALVLFVRSPWGQNIIIQKVVSHVSDKTNTEVAINRLFITFAGDIILEGLYLEDLTGDTLLYSRSLEVDVPFWPIITGNGIGVEEINWDGLRANVLRTDSLSGYNFEFLINAFVKDATQASVSDTSAAEPMQIMLGQMEFTDFDVKFKDDVMGIDSRAVLERFSVDVKTFDIAEFNFDIGKAQLSDVNLRYVQTRPFARDDSNPTAPMPTISVDELILENFAGHYASHPDGLIADVDLDRFEINHPSLDLAASRYSIDALSMSDSRIEIQSTTPQSVSLVEADGNSPKDSTAALQWPDIQAEIRKVALRNNAFSFSSNGARPTPGEFNPEAIELINLDVIAEHISLKEGIADISLQRMSFHEASGMDLKELGFDLSLTDSAIALEKLAINFSKSRLNGQLRAAYPSIQELINDPAIVQFDLLFQDLALDVNDIFQFEPSLREVKELRALSANPLNGRIEVQGSLAELNFLDNKLQWGSNTEIAIEGTVKNALHTDELRYSLPEFRLKSSRTDILRFIDEASLGIRVPDRLSVQGSATGTMKQLDGKASIHSDLGDLLVKGGFNSERTVSYTIKSSVSNLQLDELLQNEQLGSLSMTIQSKGKGNDIHTLDADLEAVVQQMNLNGYAIKDLQLKGSMEDGKGSLASQYKDENLNATLDGIVRLDTITPIYSIALDVIGIDMEALKLTTKPIRAAVKLQAELKGDLDNFELKAQIDDGTFVYARDAYRLGSLTLDAHVSPDSTSAKIRNELIDLDLQSNTDPTTFSQAVIQHLKSYFNPAFQRPDSLGSPVRIIIDGRISPAPILSEVFVAKLQELDTVRIVIDFDEQKRLLNADISAPHIDYDGYLLDSLRFTLETDVDNFNFDLGFTKVNAGPLLLKRTSFSGRESEGRLDLTIDSYDDDEQLIHMQSNLSGDSNELRYSIDPEGLTFNKEAWSIPIDNEITLSEDQLHIQNFVLRNEGQSIELTDDFPALEKDHLALLFQNFELSDFLSYLNPDEELASGQLHGNLIIEEPFGNMGFMADLDIARLTLLDVDMGRFRLDASSKSLETYDLEMSLKEGHIDLDVNGELLASGNNPSLDLTLELNRLDILAFEKFAEKELTASKGSLNGRFTVNGELNAPQYTGQIHFMDAGFTVQKLNSAFSLPDEQLSLDNKGLQFEDFTVLDANGNAFDLSGKILTKKLLNPRFDIRVDAQNFQILNATAEDNDLIYGLVIFDAEGTIKGNLDIPIIDLSLSVDPRTDVTYILPSSVAELERMDGIVVFVNREDPDAILTRTEEVTATLSGLDVNALIKIGNEAKVTMILDEETGDNFHVSGTGDLRFGMEPNGRMSLAGVYNVSSGSYEMNLYGLVDRKFELSPDSKVSWAGDPFDAKLDIRAIYRQEASSAPLMASVTSGLDPSLKTRYRQVLPFYVYLDINGVLDAPEISFALDMPEDDQGAIGGQVYGRLQQVNQQEEELNKQVFSLLVLSRFYPEPGSDGSTGGVASVARDNLNDALSDQLNLFSDKLLGQTGVQLDFGLDTYTDFQGAAPTERTQLEVAAKKSLFNDRLTVSVGSEVDIEGGGSTSDGQTPVIGKVSIEYVLTPDGQYRLKGFRKNEFDNVIDGQTIISGIALTFSQEFNEFDELWQSMLRKKNTKEGAE